MHTSIQTIRRALFAAAAIGATLTTNPDVAAKQDGQDVIKFGQSAPLTGPTAPLGLRVRAGILAAVGEVNRNGGLRGRPVELVSLDDGYEPRLTGANMRRLIDEDQVIGVMGSVGAPCAVTAVPIAQEKKTLVYGYFTGGSVLRKSPPDRYVVNFRAGLVEEVAELISAFIESGVKPEEVAFFTQQDAYGDSAFAGGIAALKLHGMVDVSRVRHVRYERNTVNIESGLSELLLMEPPPKGVIFAGAGDPTIAFVREAHKSHFSPRIGAFSFVDAMYVAQQLGSEADGLLVTQVVPPFDSQVPAIGDYQKALTQLPSGEAPSYASLESYLAARALFLAIERSPGDLSREAIVDAIRGLGVMDAGLGPARDLRMRADGHTIGGHVWRTVIEGGVVRSISPSKPQSPSAGPTAGVEEGVQPR